MVDSLEAQVTEAIGAFLSNRGFRVVWRRNPLGQWWSGNQLEWSDGSLSILATQEPREGFSLNIGLTGAHRMPTSMGEALCYCMGESKAKDFAPNELITRLTQNWDRIEKLLKGGHEASAAFDAWVKSSRHAGG